MKKANIQVKGMHCKSCEMLIEDVLGEQEGVDMVEVSYSNGEVKVLFNEDEISEYQLKSLIRDEGYGVENDC